MKKLRLLMVAMLTVICTCFLALPAIADGENLKKLDTPSWVKWDTSDGLCAVFDDIAEADDEYRIEVYKDGKQYWRDTRGKRNGHPKGKIEVWNKIDDAGSYIYRLQALGDGINTSDSDWSAWSEPFVYKKPALSFGKVRNLHWSETQTGILSWDPPANLADIPKEYQGLLRYYIKAYKNDESWYFAGRYNWKSTSIDVTDWLDEDAEYTFTVTAQSRDIEHVAHGPEIESDEYIDTSEIAENVKGDLQSICLKISGDGDDDDEPLASPSNALEEMEKLDLNETAIAVQVDEDALSVLSEIENLYLGSSGKEVTKNIAENTGLQESDIDIIGAGLNIASASNAVEISVKKPDKEVEVDSTLYSKSNQFEISIKNAVGKLRAPVTIIMPVPEDINPDRLRILHYHNDGSSEIIWPFITGDGKAKFTLTRFSLFAFVERVEDVQQGEDEPGVDDNPSHSGSSGGGGGGSSFNTSAAGTTTTDARKGKINSLTGIIIGTGDGYSKWISEAPQNQAEGAAVRWKLQYADGTFAAGSYVTDEQGNVVKDAAGRPVEQPLWELISGAWYAFGADGYARSGMTFDPALNGWFYLDINAGMKTGWQQIDGKWYYFNPTSDGTKGKMAVSTTIDGYQIDENGVWVS